MIHFKCIGCGAAFRLSDTKAGKQGKCPRCGVAMVMPTMAASDTATTVRLTGPGPTEDPTASPSAVSLAPLRKRRLSLVLAILGVVVALTMIAVVVGVYKGKTPIAPSTSANVPPLASKESAAIPWGPLLAPTESPLTSEQLSQVFGVFGRRCFTPGFSYDPRLLGRDLAAPEIVSLVIAVKAATKVIHEKGYESGFREAVSIFEEKSAVPGSSFPSV